MDGIRIGERTGQVQRVVSLRMKNLQEKVLKRLESDLAEKWKEMAAKGLTRIGGCIGVMKDIDVQGTRELAGGMVTFYREALKEAGMALNEDMTNVIVEDLGKLLDGLSERSASKIAAWCQQTGFEPTRPMWLTRLNEDYASIREQATTDLFADLATQNLKDAHQHADEDVDTPQDTLLPILARSYLEQHLQRVIDRCLKQATPISFLMLDVDFFKAFNDQYGHLIGDDVLKRVAELVKKIAGKKGVVVRYGGEEISVVLPNFSEEEALATAERIRKAVEESDGSASSDYQGKITVSLGVSTSHAPIDDKELIRRADAALRKSKEAGRNQVNAFCLDA